MASRACRADWSKQLPVWSHPVNLWSDLDPTVHPAARLPPILPFSTIPTSEHLTLPLPCFLHPWPPSPPLISTCTVRSANSHTEHKPLPPWQRKNTKQKQKEGSDLRLHVSKATKEKQHKKTRLHKVKIPVCIRQHSDPVFQNQKCLWWKSKGYGRVLFVKEKPFSEKSSLFSAHCCLLLCSCAFSFSLSCLRSKPVLWHPLTPLLLFNKHWSSPLLPSMCRKSQMMQSPPSPLKWVEPSFGSVLVQSSLPLCVCLWVYIFVCVC